ncbi:MAG: alkaline phosphatase [Bacteroidia bacterium]|jgi:alkaline phosphatase
MRTLGIALLGVLIFFASCSVKRDTQNPVPNPPKVIEVELEIKPKNIILLIGDGMGLTQVSALFEQADVTNHFKRFQYIGLMTTASASDKITDSAAGATAFACGMRTYNNAVGVSPDSLAIPNLVELLSYKGYATGMVSTSSITHATPAAFYAHAKHRSEETNIATQLITSKVNFFAGGGREYFRPFYEIVGNNNLILDTADFLQIIPDFNYAKRYGFLMANDGLPKISEGRTDVLTQSTLLGIDFLKNVPASKGFFLMSEGSQIDWGGHAGDYNYVLTELIDFNDVIGKVLDFAEQDGNTLVIVLADHETGGLALAAAKKTDAKGVKYTDYNTIEPKFSTGGHTSTLVPVFASGPGAKNFIGVYDNTEIFQKIQHLLN